VIQVARAFELKLSGDKNEAKRKLDETRRRMDALAANVANGTLKQALTNGFDSILLTLAWRYECEHKEAYPMPAS